MTGFLVFINPSIPLGYNCCLYMTKQIYYCLQRQLVAVYEVLESLNYFSEIFTILSSDMFIETDLNIDSLHRQIRPELGNTSTVPCSTFNVLCSTFTILCSTFTVLCSTSTVLCSTFTVLCSTFTVLCSSDATRQVFPSQDEPNQKCILKGQDEPSHSQNSKQLTRKNSLCSQRTQAMFVGVDNGVPQHQ